MELLTDGGQKGPPLKNLSHISYKSYNDETWLSYTFFYQTHIHLLKEKSTITRYVKCFVPGISTSKNLFKEIESVKSNAPGKSTSFEQMLVGWDEIYLQGHYRITSWRTKLSKKRLDENNNDNNNRKIEAANYH